MNGGSPEQREYTYRGLIQEAQELLSILYGSFSLYLVAHNFEEKWKLEEACVLYSRSIVYPVCAVQALMMIEQYDGEKGDEAISSLHFHLQRIIAGREEGTCSSCLLSP